MKKNETLIYGAEVRRRVQRSARIYKLSRYAVIALAAISLVIHFTHRSTRFGPLYIVYALLLLFLPVFQIISGSGSLRTCAHCQTKLSEKAILAMPEGEDFLCPHCGKVFQAKVNSEEFNF